MIRTFYFGCDFLYTAARVWVTLQLVAAISKPKWSKQMHHAIWTVTTIMTAGINTYNNSMLSALLFNGFMMIIILLLSIVSVATFYCRYRDAFCIILLLWTGLALSDFFAQTVICMILGVIGLETNPFLTATFYRGVYLLIYTSLLCAAVQYACRRMKGKGSEAGIYLKWGWFFVPPLLLCMVCCQQIYKSLVSGQMRWQWWLFLTGNVLMILFLGGYLLVREEKERGRLLKLQLYMMECDYRELLRVYEEKEILLHDFKKHMQTIRGMAEAGRKQEIFSYLDEISGTLQKGRNRDLVDHDLLNLIFNQKFQEAEAAKISLQYEMEDMGGLLLKPTEICALFSNILDNAIEANRKMAEDTERWIKLTCARKGQMLVVFISNPMVEEEIRFADGIPQTTKQNQGKHGIGMRSIRQIVNLHDGHMLVEAKDGIFSLTIYLKSF